MLLEWCSSNLFCTAFEKWCANTQIKNHQGCHAVAKILQDRTLHSTWAVFLEMLRSESYTLKIATDELLHWFTADADLESVASNFSGDLMQEPPMYSAVKVSQEPGKFLEYIADLRYEELGTLLRGPWNLLEITCETVFDLIHLFYEIDLHALELEVSWHPSLNKMSEKSFF